MPLDVTVVAIRHALGLTQAELAQTLDVHALTVSKWERGELFPHARDAALLEGLAKLDTDTASAVGAAVKAALLKEGTLTAYRLLLDGAIPKGPA